MSEERLWKCPVCGKERMTNQCRPQCSHGLGEWTGMKLVERTESQKEVEE